MPDERQRGPEDWVTHYILDKGNKIIHDFHTQSPDCTIADIGDRADVEGLVADAEEKGWAFCRRCFEGKSETQLSMAVDEAPSTRPPIAEEGAPEPSTQPDPPPKRTRSRRKKRSN